MPDIGLFELLVIGIVALIVVGPEDLPKMFATVGRWTGRVKAMAREFQRSMHDAAGEAGMGDIKKDFDNIRKYTNPRKVVREGVDELTGPLKDIESEIERGPETQKLAEQRKNAQSAARARADKIVADRAQAAAAEAGEVPVTAETPPETTPDTAPDTRPEPERQAAGARE